jgi:hypothetical protein
MAELLAASLIMKSFLNYSFYLFLTSVLGALTDLLGRMSAIQAPSSIAT